MMFILRTLQESSSDKGLSMGWMMSYKSLLKLCRGELEPPDSRERYSQDIDARHIFNVSIQDV